LFSRLLEGLPPTVFVAGDIALVISRWTLELSGADGEVSRQSGTATDVMRRQSDGTWRYVIDNPQGVALGVCAQGRQAGRRPAQSAR
jgi:ketosteroid isomerase-like protein